MRLFISINLDQNTKNELIELQKTIRGQLNQNLHITLRFLGEVEPSKIELIRQKLREISFKKFNIEIYGIDAFPSKMNPRIIWIGFKNSENLKSLERRISDKLEKEFEKESNFTPHITLARILKNEKNNFDTLKIEKITFGVEEFNLMKSSLTAKGVKHEIIETFELI